MIERFRFLQGDFAACGRRESSALRGGLLSHDGKVTKGSPGDAADGHFVPIGPLSPGPPLRGLPLGAGRILPARKI